MIVGERDIRNDIMEGGGGRYDNDMNRWCNSKSKHQLLRKMHIL